MASIIRKIGEKAADKVARASSLSQEQLQSVLAQSETYLSQKPDPGDGVAQALTMRLLEAAGVDIYKAYLPQIKELYLPVSKDIAFAGESKGKFNTDYNIRCFNITKWVVDKKENSLEKLVNIYEALSNENCNISLIFHRTCSKTNVYLAVTNLKNANDNTDVKNFSERLVGALKGNFPGSKLEPADGTEFPSCLKDNEQYSVAIASNIPGEKSEKFASQTIDKLLDGIVPDKREKEYVLILLATPVWDIENRKLNLASLYSGLAPYASWTTTFTYNEQNSLGSSATVGINVGASAGIQNGQNQSETGTKGTTDSTSKTETDSTSNGTSESSGTTETTSNGQTVSDSSSKSHSSTKGSSESNSNTHTSGSNTSRTNTEGSSDSLGAGVSVDADAKIVKAGVNVNYSHGTNESVAKAFGTNTSEAATHGTTTNFSETDASTTGQTIAKTTGEAFAKATTQAVTNTVGQAVANTLGRAVSNSISRTAGLFKATNFGVNFGANFARSSTVTATIGKSEGINQTFTNYNIKHALELLESQMKRMEQGTALGMWDFAAYVLSEDHATASNVARSYLALTQGEESYLSKTAVNVWRGDREDSDDAREICGYLRELRHPVFGLNPEKLEENEDFSVYPPVVTATTSLSGKELAYSLNFPRRSVTGLPVIECAEFGRDVITYNGAPTAELELGKIYHMNQPENTPVFLSKDSLTSHVFVTGSTGAGKSNTIYQLLTRAREQDVSFLVVEPAKGEYKQVFGMEPDVHVYGTNPVKTPMLRINPFSFPDDIHVLEHLDRLVEIFNVCWPMYAAMPAVLKNAVEKSYTDCGWDLLSSVNIFGEKLYPTFADVARNIREIIDTSDYDAENKGAYKGSLLTRLNSLTNGINGMIFTCDELSGEALFDENVIVDLSRVGSSETKSLIMGMLVLKLQEHRMAGATSMNAELKHITVLEEAHNLLRRTSQERSPDSSNLLGKSVEMLANAIAEMRTYGESFVIADQSPGLLDVSVIRNTNTKIIMRLPDKEDRELVGHAANLNDDQIAELAKLPLGVAAVYQNEWIQPILCQVEEYTLTKTPYTYVPDKSLDEMDVNGKRLSHSLLECIMNKELFMKDDKLQITTLKEAVIRSRLSTAVKRDFMEYIQSDSETALVSLRSLLYDFLEAQKAIQASVQFGTVSEWAHSVVSHLQPDISGYTKKQIDLALGLILYEQSVRDASYNDLFCRFTEIYQKEGGVF